MGSGLAWRAIGGVYVAFLLTPLCLVVLFSFTSGGLTSFPIEALSLKWWNAMFDNQELVQSFQNSLVIAAAVGATSACVGTMAALGLVQLPVRLANAILLALSLPLMLPALVLGIALLNFYVSVGLRLSLFTVVISHVLFTLPFVVLIVLARLRSFDFRIVESARDLGAGPLKAFFSITLPIIQPSIVGAALIAVALSIDDFIITFFTIGTGNTLPTFVWGMIRTSLTPMANAVGTLILLLTIGSTAFALWLTRYRG